MAIAFLRVPLQICFIDESGDLGVLGNPPLPNDQPVLVIGGLFVDVANLASLTDNFLNLKRQYFPRLPYPSSKPLDRILPEAKGADVRGNATRGTARQRTHASDVPKNGIPKAGSSTCTRLTRWSVGSLRLVMAIVVSGTCLSGRFESVQDAKERLAERRHDNPKRIHMEAADRDDIRVVRVNSWSVDGRRQKPVPSGHCLCRPGASVGSASPRGRTMVSATC